MGGSLHHREHPGVNIHSLRCLLASVSPPLQGAMGLGANTEGHLGCGRARSLGSPHGTPFLGGGEYSLGEARRGWAPMAPPKP